MPSSTQVELLMWIGPDSVLPATWTVIVKVPLPPGVTVASVAFHVPATPRDEGPAAGVVGGARRAGWKRVVDPALGLFELDAWGWWDRNRPAALGPPPAAE
ncbi:MAG: hypothetical protein ABJA34_13985 [Pseudonocardiales bacterium]